MAMVGSQRGRVNSNGNQTRRWKLKDGRKD